MQTPNKALIVSVKQLKSYIHNGIFTVDVNISQFNYFTSESIHRGWLFGIAVEI